MAIRDFTCVCSQPSPCPSCGKKRDIYDELIQDNEALAQALYMISRAEVPYGEQSPAASRLELVVGIAKEAFYHKRKTYLP